MLSGALAPLYCLDDVALELAVQNQRGQRRLISYTGMLATPYICRRLAEHGRAKAVSLAYLTN